MRTFKKALSLFLSLMLLLSIALMAMPASAEQTQTADTAKFTLVAIPVRSGVLFPFRFFRKFVSLFVVLLSEKPFFYKLWSNRVRFPTA